jgi:hypothetical protein
MSIDRLGGQPGNRCGPDVIDPQRDVADRWPDVVAQALEPARPGRVIVADDDVGGDTRCPRVECPFDDDGGEASLRVDLVVLAPQKARRVTRSDLPSGGVIACDPPTSADDREELIRRSGMAADPTARR